VDFLWQDMSHAPFWVAVGQIILVNIILSGDNAVVIAMACLTLPPRQRLWGMILGAGVAVLLRVIFTLVVAQAMTYPYLRLIGGALLFYVAIKLVTEDADGEKDGVEGAETLWSAVRIVAIADIVMSLDNVIAIAGSADLAAAKVDIAHAAGIKSTLIIFGLATSVPMIIAGAALIMALLERYRVLVWGGGALLGWVAGDIMVSDPAVAGLVSEATRDIVYSWGGPIGAIVVMVAGYWIVRKHRPLAFDELFAGLSLLVWIAVNFWAEKMFSAEADHYKIWIARGVLFAILVIAYFVARGRKAVSAESA
jgi:YjbE family integral membrane protein